MRFSSRSFFFLIKILVAIFLIIILALISLSYTKISLNRGLNNNFKEHVGYFIDSVILTKNFIFRKIDVKSFEDTHISKIYIINWYFNVNII